MRDIRFRGRTDEGEWVHGSPLVPDAENYTAIIMCDTHRGTVTCEIKPETLGQYTGVKDANGVPIYEGDIIETINNPSIRHLIFYKEEQGRFMAALNGDIENDFFGVCGLDDKRWNASKVVIGNIHDNPELLTTSK